MIRKARLVYRTLQLALAAGIGFSCAVPATKAAGDQPGGSAKPLEAAKPIDDTQNHYDLYLSQYAKAAHPGDMLVIAADTFKSASGMAPKVLDRFQGAPGKAVQTDEQGTISWEVDVKSEGLYNIGMSYYPIEGRSASIERALLIDNQIPFSEAADLQFTRVWGNQKDVIDRDNQGNDLRPEQIEKPSWQNVVLQDGEGYYEKPFSFYFSKGKHAITLKSEREPMVIGELKLFQVDQAPAYADLQKSYQAKGYQAAAGQMVQVQGEDAANKSSPTLYPISDRSTPSIEPYSVDKIRINSIGGINWRMPGQWISWTITVPKTGLYKIGIKSKQTFLRGLYASRKLTIDGQVPFREMESIPFYYKNDWRMDVLGGDRPYQFYLTEGKHELRLEAALADVAPLIRQVENSVLTLNDLYRKILMITGSAPDAYRDYQIEKQIPDMIESFRRESVNLMAVSDGLEKITGHRSEQQATLHTMADQLLDMANRPETVPKRLTAYNTNVGALGTWILSVREQPLQIDSIYVSDPDRPLPGGATTFLARAWHELRQFFYSFIIDYNQIGNISTNKGNQKQITVWIGSGRDQAQVLKSMIDDTFTPKTGIGVNVKLVQMNVLLPATLAKQGPDVAMQIGSDVPVNYAMRNAVENLAQFPDFPDVSRRFRDSAVVPYRYENGVYALPETQTFPMLFYRKDILGKLGISVPNTWRDVYGMLQVLDKNHMQLGLQRPVQQQAWQNPDPNPTMAMLLFQQGGEFYKDNGKSSALDSNAGEKAFAAWTEFYTDYKIPKEFEFANRFRTGEMPIGVADFTLYNQLAVFAPEIRGLWGFTAVPGMPQPDGSIRRDVASGGSGVVMMKAAKDKASAWEFMKWWTDASTQTKFGREMEGLMGAAARYPTANIEAFGSLPWPVAEYNRINEAFKWVRGIPQVPGGYFTGRHLDNAFWKVVNATAPDTSQHWYTIVRTIDANVGPRETLDEYIQTMNNEIKVKRREFNLPND